jgi:zinc protease
MSFSKSFTFALAVLLSVSLCADAQKKDKKEQLAPVTPAPTTPYSDVRRDSLLNGFQVVTLERPGDPLLKCDIVLRAGAMFDLVDKIGLATLTQATLMAVNPRIKEEFESLNAKIDWGADWDTTWFHIESPAANFDTAMEILARLLVVENLRTDAFKQAQQARLDKFKTRPPTPAERADEAFLSALYGAHPYGHNLEGNEKTVSGMKQGDLYDFLKRFYMGNDAFAVVMGNVKHERLMRTFKTFFGGWVKGTIVQPTFRAPTRVAALNFVKVEAPDTPNVELRGGVLGVSFTDPDYVAVELLAHLLGTRLKRAGLETVAVNHPARMLPAPFYFTASVPAEQAQAVSRQVTDMFAALATKEIAADELATIKAALAAEYAARPVEQFLREIETYNLPKTYPLTLKERIEKLTAADLRRVAKRLLEANALTVVALGRVNELKSQL